MCFAGVEARGTVFAHPPEGQGSENGDGAVGGCAGAECLEDIGPHNGVTVEDGGAVGQALVNGCFGGGFECWQLCFPGAVEVRWSLAKATRLSRWIGMEARASSFPLRWQCWATIAHDCGRKLHNCALSLVICVDKIYTLIRLPA